MQNEMLIATQKEALEAFAAGAPLADVLEPLAHWVESQSGKELLAVAIHALDESGERFEETAAPSLPESYREAVNGMDVSSVTGPCCTAVAGKRPVVASDLDAWPRFASFALPLGIRAAWSMPIVSATGNIIGTFASYFREPREPDAEDMLRAEGVTRTAALVIERQHAETRLLRRTAQFETLLNQAPLGVYLIDAQFRIRQVNPTALLFFGEIPDLMGRDFDEVIRILWPSKYADEIARLFRHTLETGESYEMPELAEQRLDRDVTGYYEWRIDRIALPEGGWGVVCYFRDISAQVLARNALAESERRIRFMAESMPQKIFTATPEGEVDYFNRQWMEFTGLSFEEIRDWGWTQFIHPDDLAENVSVWKHSIETGEPFRFEHRFRGADGEYRWHVSRALPMKDAGGRVLMWIGANTDVHEIREAHEALLAADRMKDEFLATLSHELRTPLTSIVGWTQMMAMGSMSKQEQATALAAILGSAKAQSQLIEDVLDVSRIVVGKLRLERELADLAGIVEAAVDAVRPASEARHVPLTVSLHRGLPRHFVDPTRIQQVVWNLLSNAVKFSPSGARVEVSLRAGDSSAIIEVLDHGRGIHPDFLPHIFERFRQADSSSSRANAGIGLGLSLAKELTELHGGSIEVESEEGRGSRFTVRLPEPVAMQSVEDTAEPFTAGAREQGTLDGVRVLYVDDREDARIVIGTMLGKSGAIVREAATVAEALATLKEWTPDVIVTDIAMPGRDGYELLASIRSNDAWSGLPVVALTAQSRPEDERRAAAAGFRAYLRKPVEPGALAVAVARVANGVS